MAYKKRVDGRKMNEPRAMEAEAGIIPRADGSAVFRTGDTVAYAAVYGPKMLHPRFMQDPSRGLLRCHYNMMPFAGSGDRVRPGRSRRSQEIALVTQKALLPVLKLEDFPNAVVDVFIEFPQTDAGSRCAGITAASIALADAGLTMKDMVAAVSVGRVDDAVLVDMNYAEESYEDGPVADVPMAMIPSTGEVTLLQMDGKITKDMLLKALELGKDAIKEISKVQQDALRKKFDVGDAQ